MARSVYLTKSDFKKARECPTKLYYKKKKYPSRMDDDPYLSFLADGGFMVETMARALFPEGVELEGWSEPEKAYQQALAAVASGDGVWFEPTILQLPYLIRIDILRRQGNILELIEVKSTSIELLDDLDSPFRGKQGQITSKWRPYLEDVAFQTLVLESAFPNLKVVPKLCVVNKGGDATDQTTYDQFKMMAPPKGQPRWRAEFKYLGDREQLQDEHLLAFLDVSKEVDELRDEVARTREEFAASLNGDITKIVSPPRYECKKCEYRLKDKGKGKSGFKECWGELADQQPHILDLYRVDLLGGRDRDIPREMAANGDVTFNSIPHDAYREGKTADRQIQQINSTASNNEWLATDLKERLLGHSYPLHFIDFEGSRIALPYHEGMRPYEQVGFQWSCHTIREPGGKIEHSEWLNDSEVFPNFEFAQSLKNQIGREGTVYIWSPYEITMLRDIREQMRKYDHIDAELDLWLEDVINGKDDWVIDLCGEARNHYFHPDMKGSVSIKAVFPAIWRSNYGVRKLPCFKGLAHPTDPYQALPALPIGDDEEVIREGTGAIRVYQDLMFGLGGQDRKTRAAYRKLLIQYCHLDTAAMVAIWWHWTQPKRKAPFWSRWFS